MGVRNALTFIGAVVGGIYGGPAGAQAGAAIGGIVGGIVDPEIINAPSIGDVALQKVGEGFPIAQYDGTAGGAGTLIYASAPDIRTVEEQQGKGGPVVRSKRVYLTVAILIGQALRDGPGQRTGLDGLLRAWEDEKLVYDITPTSTILAESAAWAAEVGLTFYNGTETQEPDPDIEAIEGANNVSAYRGRCYVALKGVDVTDRRGTPANYRFEVTNGAEEAIIPDVTLVTTRQHYTGSPPSLVRADSFMSWATGTDYVRAAPSGDICVGVRLDDSSVSDLITAKKYNAELDTWSSVTIPFTIGSNAPDGLSWSPQTVDGSYYLAITTRNTGQKLVILKWDGSSLTLVSLAPASVPAGNPSQKVVGWDKEAGRLAVGFGDGTSPTIYVYDFIGEALVNPRSVGAPVDGVNFTPAESLDWAAEDNTRYFAVGGVHGVFVCRDDTSSLAIAAQLSEADAGVSGPTYWDASGGYLITANKYGADTISVLQFTGGVPGLESLEFVWDSPDSLPGIIDASPHRDRKFICYTDGGTRPVLFGWGDSLPPYPERAVDQPAATGSLLSCSFTQNYSFPAIPEGATNLARIIRATGRRCKMPDAEWNLPGLDSVAVRGVVVASQGYTAQDLINGLRFTYPSDAACFNGQIHVFLRGGAVDIELDESLLVDEDSDLEQEETLQNGDDRQTASLRLPAKVNLMFPNAKLGYQLTKATSPDYGQGGESVREITIEVPVVLDEETEAPALADVLDKVTRTEARGELVRLFPDYVADQVVPGTIARLIDGALLRRGRAITVRTGEGTRRLALVLDSARDYVSQATAPASGGWPAPPPSLVGVTTLIILDLPALVDAQDALGVVAAITGEVGSAWYGALVQWRVQGATSWIDLGAYTSRTVIGELLDPLPAGSEFYPDSVNPLTVRLKHDDELETLSYVEWLSEQGALAIARDDGTAEILQPRYATNDTAQDWTLTEHQRGRLNTSAAAHDAGAVVVRLDRTLFLPLPSSALGKTLEFRAISLGGHADDAVVHDLDWQALSQTEFPVAYLEGTRAGGTIDCTWIERRRLGTDVVPIRSANWEGFRVTLTDGSTTETFDTTTASFSRSDSAFSGPVTVTVQQINRLTGRGPGTSLELS